MDLDVAMLSRIQFAVTVMFHYLYPPLSIGLGVILVVMEGMFLKTNNPVYEAMTKFWVKIFGLSFAIGVASGIVMEFQFGTNWSNYSRFVGDVFGSALAAEGIFAFFLESGFLAILLFGWDKVSRRTHFFATLMVCLGSIFSAVWIVVANSWQQTPAGFHIVGTGAAARAEITSFASMVFNPSSVVRLSHVLLGALIQGSFFVMSVTAYYLLKGRHGNLARRAFVIGLLVATLGALGQLVTGDWSARVVARHQPAKLAAFEGIYQTRPSTPLSLFGIPSDAEGRVKFGVGLPGMLSFMLYGNTTTPVPGLDQVPSADRPPVQISFQAYHLMVALGTYYVALTLFALIMLWRRKLFDQRWLMWVFVFSVVFPFVTNEVGWIAAEVGRQPWSVWGLLRTADSFSPVVRRGEVIASLTMFTLVYTLLFLLFLWVLDRRIKEGPEAMGPDELEPHHPPDDFLDAISRRGKSQFGQV
ncbi:MAG: cytochrome ubiquinol oxidase subunit I [bacterium]|nr:cytochrome ubiquinol oxidase subunit I [bacterium]